MRLLLILPAWLGAVALCIFTTDSFAAGGELGMWEGGLYGITLGVLALLWTSLVLAR